MAALGGKLTKKLVENLGPGRHGDGAGLYLVVEPSGARRWIVRVTVKGQKNAKGAPLRTDFGLGGADVVTLNQARERALEYRRMAKSGLNPRFNARREIPTFEELSRQVHIDRLPTWKNPKHGQQWLNTLRDYAFPKIGRMPVDAIGQPEVLMCLSPIWTEKHETARRLAQRLKTVLDVARSRGFRDGENPVTAVKEAGVSAEGETQGGASRGDAVARPAGLLCGAGRAQRDGGKGAAIRHPDRLPHLRGVGHDMGGVGHGCTALDDPGGADERRGAAPGSADRRNAPHPGGG